MSVDDIIPGSPLARALNDYPVPGLSAGFADRVLAAAENRAAPLPELRRTGGSGGRGWRMGRRIAIGAACFGALATTAAATGVLERFDIAVPSAEKVWASLTGKEAPVVAAPIASKPAEPAAAALAPVVIDGPIDTPEELSEAFRRIDEVREGRSAVRRQVIDQRIDRAIERRRAAGLPLPDAEQEARLRQRIDEAQTLRQQRAGERIASRREELERKVENGETVTREDFVGPRRADPATIERREWLKQLREMSPQQRREFLRNLPPEQRRVLVEEYRKRRSEAATKLPNTSAETPASVVEPADPTVQPQI
jgi:hypothetical protein